MTASPATKKQKTGENASLERTWTHTQDDGTKSPRIQRKEAPAPKDDGDEDKPALTRAYTHTAQGGDKRKRLSSGVDEERLDADTQKAIELSAQEAKKAQKEKPKTPLQRAWTTTDPATGEKGDRLVRKEAAEEKPEAKKAVAFDVAESPKTTDSAKKAALSRSWTVTDPSTGEKGSRLHRKDDEAATTEEPAAKKDDEKAAALSRSWTVTDPKTGEKGARLHRKDDEADKETTEEAAKLSRAWTKTNPATGDKDARLHRK